MREVFHHLEHQNTILPEPALVLHSSEPFGRELFMIFSRKLVYNHGGALPIMHQESGGGWDTNTQCQREVIGMLNGAFNDSLMNGKIVA